MPLSYPLRIFILIVALISQVHLAQSRQLSSTTEYLTEGIIHNSKNSGSNTDWLGWLSINNQYERAKHRFGLNLSLTHGGQPSANVVGDLQTFSNIEAGFLYGIYEMYYQFGNDSTWLKIGQLDINTEFAMSATTAFFTHSSFGIDPVLALNMPAPTYPASGLTVSSRWRLTKRLFVKTGIFDGQFAQPSNGYLRLDWTLNKDEGFIYMVEPEVTLFGGKLTQKFGFYRHSGRLPGPGNGLAGTTGFYTVGEFKSEMPNGRVFQPFIQANVATGNKGPLDFYIGAGFVLGSPFTSKKKYQMGLAVAHASINDSVPFFDNQFDFSDETVIELSYKWMLNEMISAQPYLHYIHFHKTNTSSVMIFALRAIVQLYSFSKVP